MDAQGSATGRPIKICVLLQTLLSDVAASRVPPLCLFGRPIADIKRSLWCPLYLHSAITATLKPPWQWFCLHSVSSVRPVVPPQQFWWFKEGTWVVLQQLHRNRTLWVWATTERLDHFSGRSNVARRSQPYVKGALQLFVPYTLFVLWVHTTE